MMGLLMLHDVLVWPIWCKLQVANQALAALDKFEYVDADFIGYFDSPPPTTTAMTNVCISAYKKNGQALLIAVNTSRTNASGQVTINPGVLGLPAAVKAAGWPDNSPVSVSNNCFQLSLDGLDYQMLLVTGLNSKGK